MIFKNYVMGLIAISEEGTNSVVEWEIRQTAR